MAITRVQNQVLWSGNTSSNVNYHTTEAVSDTITLDDTCVALSIQLNANTPLTPSSGDTATWRIRWSNGDLYANSGVMYDTMEHAQFLGQLDLYSSNIPGENPARMTVSVTPVAKKFQLACNVSTGGTRYALIHARIDEQRAA